MQPHNIILPYRELPGDVDGGANEVLLLSGTQPTFLFDILEQGLNEKLANMRGLFGPATYLAEDATKSNQYATADCGCPSTELHPLHARLFHGQVRHSGTGREGGSGDLFYCMVVRSTLGWYQRTRDGSTNLDQRCNVFANDDKRELNKIPGTATRYHSLFCELGGKLARHREFMIYNANQMYIEYVIAYRRE